jgi:hypothetical protein
MSHSLDAKTIIGTETSPAADGARLAHHILRQRIPLSGLAPEVLVSTFVNAFLHELEAGGVDISEAEGIAWQAKFESEANRLRELISYYVQDVLALKR